MTIKGNWFLKIFKDTFKVLKRREIDFSFQVYHSFQLSTFLLFFYDIFIFFSATLKFFSISFYSFCLEFFFILICKEIEIFYFTMLYGQPFPQPAFSSTSFLKMLFFYF
ncbi:hypothetical protein Lalb_Chr00c01g0403901 [Lupinus albus]|uniref:Uncharacterized protein n=1 Tax=Lupinus albus TaxID=3870 RepID=A0A6A4MWQ2_LUPAL|nr:hypothetical protein Lalb_Chr00c01g0403901 [Lupinus albus]